MRKRRQTWRRSESFDGQKHGQGEEQKWVSTFVSISREHIFRENKEQFVFHARPESPLTLPCIVAANRAGFFCRWKWSEESDFMSLRVFAMIESGKSLPRDVESLKRSEAAANCLMAARNALRKGERERAKAHIKEAFAHTPGNIAALDLLGDMLLEDGETEQALRFFERALQAHPGNANFEEKLGICRLDLAEIEADKQLRQGLILGDEKGKIFERSLAKAVTLSMMLPGAGQFYNDENERGIGYLVAGIVSSIAWFYPLWSSLSRLPKGQRLDFESAIHAMSGIEPMLFYLGATAWSGIFTASLIGAITSTKRYNEARRLALGL